jgi:ABC-type polysaccharide/polyol phosphate export permease
MHKIPVHLDTQDTFLWNFTFRQVLILFTGGGMAYFVMTTDWSTPIAALIYLLLGGFCLSATLLVAFVRIKHRDLDQWLLVAFLFYSGPRIHLWRPLYEQEETRQAVTVEPLMEKDSEEW